MDRWIRDLINSMASGLTALVNAVAERISWVYNVFIALLIKVRTAFDRTVGKIQSGIVALSSLASEAYTTLRWLINIRIPQVVNGAVSTVTNWIVAQLNSAISFLRGLIDGVRTWVQQQIQRIDHFIDDIIRWISTRINEVVSILTWVYGTVVNLLTDPRRMATWVIDSIIGEFWRWLDRNADRVFLLIQQRSIHYTMRAADRIENLISRLL